ncbi:MAG: purine-nucleoside phosphorylase [Anaerotruncus rubiinfantis]|jgi:purine-nucleoside phosphorylase
MLQKKYPTPHINARPGDFAETVLMPGDPLRSRFIAENFLEHPRLVNDVRGVQGYTGVYKGTQVSVMASGMGMPSMGIYSYELYTVFGVEHILRIGSAGSMQLDVKVRDLVLGMGASTNSAFARQFGLPGDFAPLADYRMLHKAVKACKALKVPYHVGNILSSDTFYNEDETAGEQWAKMGVLAVEMEAAALYMTAARCGKQALALLTVSDNVRTGEATTAEERQNSFTQMIEAALETAAAL